MTALSSLFYISPHLSVPVLQVLLKEAALGSIQCPPLLTVHPLGQLPMQGREHPLTPLVVEHLPLALLLHCTTGQHVFQLLSGKELVGGEGREMWEGGQLTVMKACSS